jgi:beta-1,2-mannobiose phosphorylase / 1,2-beta-oligomannan phosphorylase
MECPAIASLEVRVHRLGVVLEPLGGPLDAEGILNPATARTRDGRLLLYPRMVAPGNRSRIGIFEGDGTAFNQLGFALEPEAPYELRDGPAGYGCEDPRVTFVPALDRYVMAYTAYGPDGPRIAVALSHDGYVWRRVGLVDFSSAGLPNGDDKDAAFFPEPVLSPRGVPSLAMYHRPMLRASLHDGLAAIPRILDLPALERESTRIAYIPLERALQRPAGLLAVAESTVVLAPAHDWGRVKNGAGTPPVRTEEGWFSVFHGVDAKYDPQGKSAGMRYSAGVVIHDAIRPHIVLYRSPQPVLVPETEAERHGTVNDVVFPTGIDVRADGPAPRFDIYYGMADSRVGRASFALGEVAHERGSEESAA